MPLGAARRTRTHPEQRADQLLEATHRNTAQAVPGIDGLALLGHTQAVRNRVARQRAQCVVDTARRPPEGSAAGMTQGELYAELLEGFRKRPLRLIEIPPSGKRIAIAVRAGITEDDRLMIAALTQVLAIDIVIEQARHDARCIL